MFLRGAGRYEILLCAFQLLTLHVQLPCGLEILHGLRKPCGVMVKQVVQVSLEVATDANIHGWRHGLLHRVLIILALREEAMQNVVGVRGHDQIFDRQAHSLCIVPCEDIPEVARGHAETDLTVQAGKELEIRGEVVRDLEHDPRPVDGIHCSQPVLFLEVQVCKQLLHYVLAIVEGSFDGHAMHIVIQNAGHLLLLNVGHTALWKEDEAVHVLLAPHSIDGGATGVTAGGAEDG
mmetsp:Transcript_55837/g.113707  ORF Transcript_55837/g.113707 Transcript_55837/m.113707 type:complete len:235 (-) Transcript_55837:463-1167(-)